MSWVRAAVSLLVLVAIALGKVALEASASTYVAERSSDIAAFIASPTSSILLAVVLLLLWAGYWFWADKRIRKQRINASRFKKALESEITRHYQDNPANVLSQDGARHESAPDFERRSVYERAEIGDLFDPTPSQGVKILRAKIEQGIQLADEIERDGLTADLKARGLEWERLSKEDALIYIRSGVFARGEARQFARASFTAKPSQKEQLAALRYEIRSLERFVNHLAKQARQQAERADGSP